jgi:hypothetical protein
MEVLANSLRLPPDREVQKKRADAPPKATASKVDVRLAQPRKEAPPPCTVAPAFLPNPGISSSVYSSPELARVAPLVARVNWEGLRVA